MSGEFLGTFHVSVNKQKWIVIPSAFKKEISPAAKQNVIITRGSAKNQNIIIFPLDIWQEKTKQLMQGDTRARELYDYMLFYAFKSQLETNGRIKLDDSILQYAEIVDKVVIKGEGSFISVWNPEVYQTYEKTLLDKYKESFTNMDFRL
jgi:DNA-binding transcriptional regulator/RsmH inhibitor MraZ